MPATRLKMTTAPRATPPPPRRALVARRGQRGQSLVEFALLLPLLLIVLLGVLDLARVYTTMMSVESAAREAADYGTTLGAGRWAAGSAADTTVAEMQRRACVAASDLPDYADPDNDLTTGNCTNPAFTYCMTSTVGGTCDPGPVVGCEDPLRSSPCRVTVTLAHQFRLIAPFNLDFFGIQLGLPSQLTFQRDSTFAITDIAVAP